MRTLEQIVKEIIILSREAATASLLWEGVQKRCERYLGLMGAVSIDILITDLNTKLHDIKSKRLDGYVDKFQKLVEELNECT